jgi:TonB family protein
MKSLSAVSLSLAIVLALGGPSGADEALVAGQNGIPVPRKTRNVLPTYPPEAQARGQRGIVILEIVIDTQGKVSAAQVIRSIPPFDEAALAAVRQWEYEVTKVEGKPVSVKLTVPITFAMRIPEIASRQEGIPELRAGAFPPLAPDAREIATATAEITLGAEGSVEELRIVDGPPAYADALARALRTWRFAPESSDVTVTFQVHAEFNPSAKSPAPKIAFRLDGLRRSESMAAAGPEAAATAAAPPLSGPDRSPEPSTAAGTAGAPLPEPASASAAPPPPVPAPAAPAPAAPAAASAASPSGPPAPASEPALATAGAPAAVAPAPQAPAAAAETTGAPAPPASTSVPSAPPVEVLSIPPPAEPPENGLSAVRDVTLTPGVPDLTRGRRPVPPPFARMAQATGTIDVKFSVDAAGIAAVKGSTGPDVFKRAAEQAVSSWTFRRTRADRIFLLAEFKYTVDAASATVRPDVN